MSRGITISGLDDCLRCLDEAPQNLMKMSRQALKDASRVSSRTVRSRIPKRWNRLVRYKVVKTSNGKLNAVFGLFNGHQVQGHQDPNGAQIADWFKAYWINYGTLQNRDPSHHFQNPVRHHKTAAARRRRNTDGIRPRNFFEAAIAGWEGPFVETFRNSLKKQEAKLYER